MADGGKSDAGAGVVRGEVVGRVCGVSSKAGAVEWVGKLIEGEGRVVAGTKLGVKRGRCRCTRTMCRVFLVRGRSVTLARRRCGVVVGMWSRCRSAVRVRH